MSTKAARGMKRTCQNSECGSRFYDLNRDPIVCPECGGLYTIAHSPLGAAVMVEDRSPRKPKKEVVEKELAPVAAEGEAEEALADIEDAVDIPADDDETFLEEEEEEGGDVATIIDVPGGDEEV
jgi:uncharacterized protein (TIGR02300 family)